MSENVLFAQQVFGLLPFGIRPGSAAGRQLTNLISGHLQKRDAKTVLKLEGEPNRAIYLILSGWICVSKSMKDGHRQIVDVILPGGILEPASADLDASGVDIETLSDVTYAAIPRGVWLRFVDKNPEIANILQREIGSALTRMSERLLRIGKGDAETIIAYALCELCLRSTGASLREVKIFHIPMTQQQLGDLCGLSSVHICRTLRRLKRNGILDVRNHMEVTIHDVDALADIAEIDPDRLQKEIVPAAQFRPFKVCG